MRTISACDGRVRNSRAMVDDDAPGSCPMMGCGRPAAHGGPSPPPRRRAPPANAGDTTSRDTIEGDLPDRALLAEEIDRRNRCSRERAEPMKASTFGGVEKSLRPTQSEGGASVVEICRRRGSARGLASTGRRKPRVDADCRCTAFPRARRPFDVGEEPVPPDASFRLELRPRCRRSEGRGLGRTRDLSHEL